MNKGSSPKLKRGFTLIELLVVISIIGILAALGLMSYRSARDAAKMAQTQTRMRELRTMMEQYRLINGELPPMGDACACSSGTSAEWTTEWTRVINALVEDGILSSAEMPKYQTDAWGKLFYYDDNDGVCCGSFSYFYTLGPNMTDDREGATFHEGEKCDGDDWCLDFPYGNP